VEAQCGRPNGAALEVRGERAQVKLTDSQRKAIEHDGRNLQLIACAGSGKTEVVARRVVYLLSPGKGAGLAPRNIIAFTFTDKAAAELKERIVTRTRQNGSEPRSSVLTARSSGALYRFTHDSWRAISGSSARPW
jgi:superfamily I DNA/RNA helicase